MTKIIGILGGTFDPVHLGHLHIANEIYQQLHPKEIRFIPCYLPVHRTKPQATVMQRIAMLNLALEDKPHFVLDQREIQRAEPSYMIDTLHSLRTEFPQESLCLILGSDAFAGFDCWKQWQEILELCHLIVIDRPEARVNLNPILSDLVKQRGTTQTSIVQQNSAGAILLLPISPCPISATAIRDKIKHHLPVSPELNPKVWEYIIQHQIYQNPYN